MMLLRFLLVGGTLAPSFAFISNLSSYRNPTRLTYSEETEIVSPVLKSLWPHLRANIQTYGHPNIPLGTSAGRQCQTLRRLHAQQKLTASDVALLESLNFTFYNLEDIYASQLEQFDELLERLLQYQTECGDLSPPKKYAPDPELGAWVTALRRLRRVDGVQASHVQKLDEIGFLWESPRKCGSEFMKVYREIQADSDWANNPNYLKWIRAQQKQSDALSATRTQYLRELLGDDWAEWEP